jgi:hypothetical protein
MRLSAIKFISVFFAFGATMCALTVVLVLFPGTGLDFFWKLNPEAHAAFQSIGNLAVLLMFAVGIGCAFAATGLWHGCNWGVRLALIILLVNIIGDLLNAFVRHDYRALIGLPISAALIFYLARHRKADS